MKKLMIAAAACAASAVPAEAVVVQWTSGPGANNHYYELVLSGANFATALTNAAAATPIAGYAAHLATITSAEENAFIASSVFAAAGAGLQATWVAGSDAVVEGEWRWIAGPEIGQLFWTGGPGGTASGYANWQSGSEPNNFGDEDGLSAFYFNSPTWNDFGTANGTAYLIEWSPSGNAVPEPAAWALMIAGFGLAGTTVRSRRRPTVTA